MPRAKEKAPDQPVIETVEEPTHAELVIVDEQTSWTPAQISGLHAMGVSEDATQAELDIFLHVAKRSQLDPFSRQIYLVARKDRGLVNGEWQDVYKSTIQTGIDGYRVIARRAADKAGATLEYEDAQWCGQDGVWRDVWLDATSSPSAAKVTVLRDGKRFSAVALFVEYAQTKRKQNDDIVLTGTWKTRGAGQLAKCAEALALRKAFPLDLSGIYTDEEMGQADNPAGATIVEGQVVKQTEEPDEDAGDLGAALAVDPRYHAIAEEFKRLKYPANVSRRNRIRTIIGREIPMDPAVAAGLSSDELDLVLEELRIEPEPTDDPEA